MAAIAFDAATDGGFTAGATSLTWAHTCTGTNRILRVDVMGIAASDSISGATYNGVAMTLIAKVDPAAGGSARWIYAFLLVNPASGANNVVVSASASIQIGGVSVSYTGARQGAQPDNSGTAVSGVANSITTSLTPVANNCWLTIGGRNDAGASVAGTGATLRVSNATIGQAEADGNAAITPPASTSIQLTCVVASVWSVITATIAPAATIGDMFEVF